MLHLSNCRLASAFIHTSHCAGGQERQCRGLLNQAWQHGTPTNCHLMAAGLSLQTVQRVGTDAAPHWASSQVCAQSQLTRICEQHGLEAFRQAVQHSGLSSMRRWMSGSGVGHAQSMLQRAHHCKCVTACKAAGRTARPNLNSKPNPTLSPAHSIRLPLRTPGPCARRAAAASRPGLLGGGTGGEVELWCVWNGDLWGAQQRQRDR